MLLLLLLPMYLAEIRFIVDKSDIAVFALLESILLVLSYKGADSAAISDTFFKICWHLTPPNASALLLLAG